MSTPIDISEHEGVRYLHFGSEWIQGAMRIRRPNHLELTYTREMMMGLLLRAETAWPRSALLIGLGAASLTRFMHHYLPETHLTVVEIEPAVVAAARQFFRLPEESDRFRLIIDDGVRYILRHKQCFDYILVDGFDQHAKAGELATLPFYQAARTRLSEQGLLCTNLFGRVKSFERNITQLQQAFDNRVLALPSSEAGNVIAFGAKGDTITTDIDQLRTQAGQLKKTTGLDLSPSITALEQSGQLLQQQLIL